MPSLKLSNPFRRGADRPSLKQRAASLKASASRVMKRRGPVQEAPTTSVDIYADALLLDLGRRFATARALEEEAGRRVSEAWDASLPWMPTRPAGLTFREEDAQFPLRSNVSRSGSGQVCEQDITWMGRRPIVREVWVPAPAGQKGWDMVPGKVPELQPWPEAQARADEIIAAWVKWNAERERVQIEHGVPTAEAAENAAIAATKALALRIAEVPATTAEGMRVKLRVRSFYEPEDEAEQEGARVESILARSLYRDALATDTIATASWAAPLPRGCETPTDTITKGWAEWARLQGAGEEPDAAGNYPSQLLRDQLLDTAEALPATPENLVAKALALAWLEYVDHWRQGWRRDQYSFDGRLAMDIHAVIVSPEASA